MLYRRAAGMFAAFLLIPQLLGASEIACSRHSDAYSSAAATEPMAGHEHHDESAGQNTAPPEQHLPTDCCPAMSTCPSGTAIQAVDSALGSWPWHNEAPLDVVTLSHSRVESPDPPPPKA